MGGEKTLWILKCKNKSLLLEEDPGASFWQRKRRGFLDRR
jgi:hypothetical protein